MRHSSSVFWKNLLVGAASAVVLSGCSSTPPSKPSADPYDRYYGLPDAAQDAANGDIIVNPAAPQSYVVKKGDTLWGIARKFLNTPWYWPEVWDKNQGVKNPHLIYPGDVLYLDYVQGSGSNGNKLVPRIRVDHRGQGEPISTLIPFLSWPRVLDEATIKNAPYVLASSDAHDLIGEGETIYVKNLRNASVGTRCAIFHPNKALKDLRTGEVLGYEVTYGGYSRVTRVDDPSTAVIVDAKREIRQGDRLYVPVDENAALNAPLHSPNSKVRADVISLYDAQDISGTYMIAAINKGARDHIEVGHVLGIYATGKTVSDQQQMVKKQGIVVPTDVQLPPEKAANLVIYKVTDKVSYGLILDATHEVKAGYKIGNP